MNIKCLTCICLGTTVINNKLTFERFSGAKLRVMNFGSYNYLGFAESVGPCADLAEEATKECGVGVSSTRRELGELSWVSGFV